MSEGLLFLLLLLNAPLYVLAGACFFGSRRTFYAALRTSARLEPDVDWRASARLVAWAALCALAVFTEHHALVNGG